MSVYRGCQAPGPGPQVTLVTAGPAEVGKTSLISRFCNDTFNEVIICQQQAEESVIFSHSWSIHHQTQ